MTSLLFVLAEIGVWIWLSPRPACSECGGKVKYREHGFGKTYNDGLFIGSGRVRRALTWEKCPFTIGAVARYTVVRA